MITIRTFNRAQLEEFVNSQEYAGLDFLPISRHRAMSQVRNPRVLDHHILLFMAYENDVPVAYLGALPDRIFLTGDNSTECAWMSCIWVHEQYRGKQLAQKLVESCYKAWDKHLLGTEFAESSGRLFDKMGIFDDLQTKEGVKLYIRSDLYNILPPRKPVFKHIRGFLKVFDWLTNLLLDLRFLFIKKDFQNFKHMSSIDGEVRDFIMRHQENELFRRSPGDLQWIIDNPWVMAGKEDDMSRKYHFSSVDASFDFLPYTLYDADHNIVAFLIFTKRNGVLKLPYCYMAESAAGLVRRCIEHFAIRWRINSFICFHPSLVPMFRGKRNIALLTRPFRRRYIISRVLKDKIHTPRTFVQDGDADTAFT